MIGYQLHETERERLKAAVEHLEAGGNVVNLTVAPVPEGEGPSFLYPVQAELGEIGDDLRALLVAALQKKLGG